MEELASNGVEIYRFPVDDETVAEMNASMNVSTFYFIFYMFTVTIGVNMIVQCKVEPHNHVTVLFYSDLVVYLATLLFVILEAVDTAKFL